MCGRTACTRAPREIADACSYRPDGTTISKPQWKSTGSYKPSYNNGPKSYAPILLKNQDYPSMNNEMNSERVLLPMQWGLIPSWHKGDPKAFSFNMINCRCDTLTQKRSFMKALEKGQRCVVLADGFYEWHVDAKKKKQPYYIQLKDSVKPHAASTEKQMITMAGLFDKQVSDEVGELYTYTIVTVDSSSSMKWLHHRMPSILETEDVVNKWLDVDNVSWKKALDLLVPTDCLEWHPVSTVVNNSRNNTAECIKKIDIAKEAAKKTGSGKVMSMWLKKAKRKTENSKDDSLSKKQKT